MTPPTHTEKTLSDVLRDLQDEVRKIQTAQLRIALKSGTSPTRSTSEAKADMCDTIIALIKTARGEPSDD